jgi:hypothetical protein
VSAAAPGLLRRTADRLSELGRRRGFRIAVASFLSVAVIALAGILYAEASSMRRLSSAIPAILEQANLAEKDAVALGLVERGTVEVGGRTVGDAALATRMQRLFEESGRLERVAEATSLLVGTMYPRWLPVAVAEEPWLALAGAAVALAAIHFACFGGLVLPLLAALAASAGLGGAGLLLATLGVRILGGDPRDLVASLVAIPLFLLVFGLFVHAALAVLDRASPAAAVAGGVVREAMRLRIAVAFAAVAIVVIPLLPVWIDRGSPLRYQVQTYLSRSLDVMFVSCALLTVFLGCATVAFEIRDRQAWLTLTKPVSRFSWLLGKWLGLVVLNGTILLTASLAMYSFLVQVRSRAAQDIYDALAVEDEVLVARVGGFPRFEMLPTAEIATAVEEAMRADPNIQADLRDGVRTEIEIKKELARSIGGEYLKAQRSIAPNTEREYRFAGLSEARKSQSNMTLRFKFFAGSQDPNERFPVVFIFGEGDAESWDDRRFTPAQANVVPVPFSAIAPDGTLTVRVANIEYRADAPSGQNPFIPGRATIAFDPDGLELLYRVGGFGDNLVRAQVVNLLKLSFLAMLSVVCASFLSFPVACLVVFTIFAAGSLGPFLASSIAEYRIRTESSTWKAVEATIKAVASATEFTVRAYGEAGANGPLVEGRLVSWGVVGRTFALIGLAWSGILLVVGGAIFRRKELAIYSGQGG